MIPPLFTMTQMIGRLCRQAVSISIPFQPKALSPETTNTVLVLGFLGTWRYSWAAINFSRAILYYNVIYPRRKAKAFARFKARGAPCHAYFLVTSYMVDRDITIECYNALYLAASRAAASSAALAAAASASAWA